VYGDAWRTHLDAELAEIREAGTFKRERVLASPQGARIATDDGAEALNLCANNYLGLADDPRPIAAAKAALDARGYGMASVRFICGTADVHTRLESAVSRFLGTEATILYSSCFDANGGLFEVLLGAGDAVISDELNHASIIDGVRLCKARRLRYRNNDLDDLAAKLIDAADARFRLIVTDGVFSMDGVVADLAGICDLADRHDALVVVDDSHATGFHGPGGRGTPAACGVADRVDLITSTFGKALGGASGGFTSGRREVVELLRQRSRPYLFSNSLAPAIAAATLRVIELLESDEGEALRAKLRANTAFFRDGMRASGFDVGVGDHPIVPIMCGDAALAARSADELLARGIYVIGFSYPVVPQDEARIRVQISAAHDENQLARAIDAFADVVAS